MYFIVRDEYKEFEKLIQEDLQEVDDRLEEEEVIPNLYLFLSISWLLALACIIIHSLLYVLQIDAAEMIEEAETLEQK